jgi:hypothetical protein
MRAPSQAAASAKAAYHNVEDTAKAATNQAQSAVSGVRERPGRAGRGAMEK